MAHVYSVDLNGTSDYLSIAHASQTGLSVGSNFTIEAWIKPDVAQTMTIAARNGGSDGSPLTNYLFQLRSDGKLEISWRNNATGTGYSLISTDTVSAMDGTTWTHVAVAFNDADQNVKRAYFYFNGVADTNNPRVNTNSSSFVEVAGLTFYIGVNNDEGTLSTYFNGHIDDVRFWNDLRTSSEISFNYYSELTGSESNLNGYWKLEQNGLDETSNNNDLTASGTLTYSTDVPVFVSSSLSPSISPSQSPSASISPSLSPSISPSLSPSISPSQSPSASISPSFSPSQSPSASISPSFSPSLSPSISPSVSPSISPSVSDPPESREIIPIIISMIVNKKPKIMNL